VKAPLRAEGARRVLNARCIDNAGSCHADIDCYDELDDSANTTSTAAEPPALPPKAGIDSSARNRR
jgi:hypothetical protein